MIAVRNRHDYTSASPDPDLRGSEKLAIVVKDIRTEITAGGKYPWFCGYMRSGVGIPYDIRTINDAPFAADVLTALTAAFKKCGFEVMAFTASKSESRGEVVDQLGKSGADKILFITLEVWRTDTYINVDLYCDVTVEVLNGKGEMLAENRVVANRENLGGSFWNPPKHARKAAPLAFKNKMEILFGNDSVKAALNG